MSMLRQLSPVSTVQGPRPWNGVPLAAATLGVGLPTSINSCNPTQAYPEICRLSYSRS